MCIKIFLIVLLAVASISNACRVLSNGYPQDEVLNKRKVTEVPICIILNDRYLYSSLVTFDSFTRLVFKGSHEAVTKEDACSDPSSPWFPNGCDWVDGAYGPGLGMGAPTNFYVSVQGVSSNYRKRYARLGQSPSVTAVFPIVTVVINVEKGVVKDVYWDDDCYFNLNREAGSSGETGTTDTMACEFNAFDMENMFVTTRNQTYRSILNPKSGTTNGYDTLITNSACAVNQWKDPDAVGAESSNEQLPKGFCDLGIYITWVGTSADGQQLGSATPRFKSFRDYSMLAQYPTMINFLGHNISDSSA